MSEMSLKERTLSDLRRRRQNILDGKINSIPSPFPRFSEDFVGLEQSEYIAVTSFTKGGKTQFVLYMLFEALMYLFKNRDKARMKVFYFVLEETPDRILQRFMCYLLYKLEGIRYSPRDLRSTKNDQPISEEILSKFEQTPYKEYIEFFESTFVFSTTSNPTGIYYECKKYAEENGVTHKTQVSFSEDEVFDYYTPNDPFELRIVVIDHISLIDSERGMTKKEAIDKLSEYLAKFLRNRYGFTPIVIQQQSTENESSDNFKLGRIRPSGAGLSDSKYVQRDVNILMGLFSPAKFGLREYLGYDITKFQDRIRFLEMCNNRDGEAGGIIALYFDGATCTFEELPQATDRIGLQRWYDKIEGEHARISMFMVRKKLRKRFNDRITYGKKRSAKL